MSGSDRSWRRRVGVLQLLGALVLASLSGVARADDEREAARRFAREELLRVAGERVAPDDPSIGGIEDLRNATQAARERLEMLLAAERTQHVPEGEERETLVRPLRGLDQLIGTTEKGPGGSSDGLIRQGARLYRWVVGRLEPSERGALIPPEEPASADPAGKGQEPKEEPDGEEGDEEAEPGDEKQPAKSPAPTYGTDYLPRFELFFSEGRKAQLPVDGAPRNSAEQLALLAEQSEIEQHLRDGEIRITWASLQAPGQAPQPAIKLQGIEELGPYAGTSPSNAMPRFVLALPDELVWKWGADYVGWRRWQVKVRRAAMQAEETRGLVNDAQVDQKALRATEFANEVVKLDKRRGELLTAFDQMRAAERYWLDEADRLELAIEEIGHECDNCAPDELVAFQARYDVAQLRGRLVQQEQRLLYITVLRAGKRLQYLEESLDLAREEAQLAKTVHQRFLDARNRARRDRQLASLTLQRGDLQAAVERARARAESGGEASPWGAFADELERLARVNSELQSLVQIRRRLEQSAAPPATTATRSDSAVGEEPKDAEAGVDPAVPDGAAGLAANLRDPRSSFVDETFAADARAALDHPGFDGPVVAQHYAVVDDVVNELDDAMRGVADLDAREARIKNEIAAANQAFAAETMSAQWPDLQLRRLAMRESKNLRRMEATFEVTMRGIREQQDRIRKRIAVLRTYREELQHLGLRSFGIRTDRTLSVEGLQAAGDDAGRAIGAAGSWLTLEGEAHGGHFIGRHWQRLLLVLLAVGASFLLVRLARRGIDRTLRRLAARQPHLRTEPITIGTEAAEVREQRALAEAARRDAETAALAEASGEAERKRAVSGGGEGGE